MFKLDDNLLRELGLGSLPPQEKNRMLAHIYETLEMRVGMKLAEQMSNEQLDEFEGFIDKNDEAGALKWLETNFPNYKQVVADELEALKKEIKHNAEAIVAATMGAQGQPGQMASGAPAAGPIGSVPAPGPAPMPSPSPAPAGPPPQPQMPPADLGAPQPAPQFGPAPDPGVQPGPSVPPQYQQPPQMPPMPGPGQQPGDQGAPGAQPGPVTDDPTQQAA